MEHQPPHYIAFIAFSFDGKGRWVAPQKLRELTAPEAKELLT